MGHHKKQFGVSKGFTIVELLIVVVVIAILAAITIVAYNGIQSRAKTSAAQSAATQAHKKVALWLVDNPNQAPDFTQFNTLVGASNIGQYQYTQGVSGAFCVTATPSNISYYVSDTQATPTVGACDGHGINGVSPITNLVTNPSVETNSTGWGLSINASVSSQNAGAALFGGFGITSTAPANNIDSGVSIPVPGTFTAGTAYTASISIRAITAGNYSLSPQGTAGSVARDTRAIAANTTQRFTYTWTPTSTGGINLYALRNGGQAGTHTFYVDGAMVTVGAGTPAYADGNSSGWVWTSTTNNSTSTGPPL